MPIWKTESIKEQPSVRLSNWSIRHMKEGSFFVGDEIGAAGRVSTDIVEFDAEKKVGRTASGRVYQLVGREGCSLDGEYVWNIYKNRYKLTEIE